MVINSWHIYSFIVFHWWYILGIVNVSLCFATDDIYNVTLNLSFLLKRLLANEDILCIIKTKILP